MALRRLRYGEVGRYIQPAAVDRTFLVVVADVASRIAVRDLP